MGGNLSPSFWAKMGAEAKFNPFILWEDVTYGFPKGGYLDAQPFASGNAFERAAYGNYVFGVYVAAAGIPLEAALFEGNQKAQGNPAYRNRTKESLFGNLPAANVMNIAAGYIDQEAGFACQE